MVVLFAIRMAKLSRLAGGTSPEGAERVSRPQEHNTGRIYGQNESGKGENHSCAWETPPALRATSPTRQRSFASGGTNSSLRWISNPTRPTLYDLCVPTLIFRCPAFLMKPMGCLCAPFWMGAKSDNVIRFQLYILFYIRL